MTKATALILAVIAYTLLAAGLVLMKKGIGWMERGRPRDAARRKDLAVWLAGFFVSNAYIVPVTAALRVLPPHVVGAFAGWGVAVMVLLSGVWLGEKLRASDAAYTVALVLAIGVLGLSGTAGTNGAADVPHLVGAMAIPFLLLPAAFLWVFSRSSQAVLFAAVSGISAGLIVVLMKVLVLSYGGLVGAYFGSVYLYLYLVFSLLAFLALQLAYKRDVLMRVGPVQYAASILYPAVCSALVFGNRVRPLQALAILGITLAVAGMLRRR